MSEYIFREDDQFFVFAEDLLKYVQKSLFFFPFSAESSALQKEIWDINYDLKETLEVAEDETLKEMRMEHPLDSYFVDCYFDKKEEIGAFCIDQEYLKKQFEQFYKIRYHDESFEYVEYEAVYRFREEMLELFDAVEELEEDTYVFDMLKKETDALKKEELHTTMTTLFLFIAYRLIVFIRADATSDQKVFLEEILQRLIKVISQLDVKIVASEKYRREMIDAIYKPEGDYEFVVLLSKPDSNRFRFSDFSFCTASVLKEALKETHYYDEVILALSKKHEK